MRMRPRCALPALTFSALLLCLLGCSPAERDSEPSTARTGAVTREPLRFASPSEEIRNLIVAVTALGPEATKAERSAWHGRRQDTLARLRGGTLELGREALRVFTERTDATAPQRFGLLEVAAHNAPEETRAQLVSLSTTWGADLGLRTKAVRLLGATSPRTALELVQPLLLETRRTVTMPAEDQMLEALLSAYRTLDEDPAPLLAEIATSLAHSQEVRHLAARTLGEHPHPRGIQALESLLVDSSGNNYLRVRAGQSLLKVAAREDYCARIAQVLEREVDAGFIRFLASAQEANCR